VLMVTFAHIAVLQLDSRNDFDRLAYELG